MNATNAATYRSWLLEPFFDDIRSIVKRGGTETVVTQGVADRLGRLLATGQDFIPDQLAQPSRDGYALYALHVEPDGSFCVASAVWDVTQKTPIHDHGTWGVIGIYRGVEHEARYAPNPSVVDGPPVFLHEHDVPAGSVTICCTTDADLHQVSCASEIPCVGIHVYGGNIGEIERHAIDGLTGAVTLFVSRWASPAASH